jgi:hypothetical protein
MGERRGAYRVLVGKPEEDPGVVGRIILKWIIGSGMGSMNWIDMAQNRWRTLLNAVMKVHIP